MWILGKLFKLAMILIIFAIIAGIGFIFFVNPNHFKPQITQILQNYVGQPLQINGSIEWSLNTQTIITLHDVSLAKSPDDKTPALQIKEAVITIDIFSLLKASPIINNLTLNNVIVDWAATKALTTTSKTTGRQALVEEFHLKNGSMGIQDPTDHLNWLLQNITLHASNYMLNSGQEMPSIQIQGDLVNLDLNAKYELDTNLKLDNTKHSLMLDPLKLTWNDTPIQGTANIEQYDTSPVISGNMSLDPTDVGALLKKMDPYFANSTAQITHTMKMQTDYSYITKDQILDLTKLQLQVDKGMISGDVKVGFTSPYHAEFTLNANNIDFVPLGLLGSAMFPSMHTMNTIPAELIKNIVVVGKFSGTQITISHDLAIDQLHMEINGQGGVVQLMPVIINAYGGTHNAALHLDVTNEKSPAIQFTEQADKVELGPWLKLIGETSSINGTASVKANLQATGVDLSTLKQSVSGGVNIYVNDGTLTGFDATKIMQFSTQTASDIFTQLATSPAANLNVLAVKLSSDWIKTQQDNPSTKFDHFEFNADFSQGVSSKTNIAMSNNVVDLKGSGKFTISDQSIKLDSTMVDKADINADSKVLVGYMKQTPITMSITGTLNKPVFGPNVQTFLTTVLKSTQDDLLNQAISKMVAVSPPNAKTDKTASDLFINSLQSLSK